MKTTRENIRLTADVVLIAPPRHVLLIRRRWDPYKDRWALPGGHLDDGEEPIVAAHRELTEETGIVVDSLSHVGVYADPGRDPRGRYVTFVYSATVQGDRPVPNAADDAVDARWWPFDDLTSEMMAFDHYSIICDSFGFRRGS
jgi:8-oxo-dGTP diphosphatase